MQASKWAFSEGSETMEIGMGELKEGESGGPETRGGVPGPQHGGNPANDAVVQFPQRRRSGGAVVPEQWSRSSGPGAAN